MRRTHKSRKSTKLENSLWHYKKFFREVIKQRRINFMQQQIYQKFHFGIIHLDCLLAAAHESANIEQQTQEQESQQQPQRAVQVREVIKEADHYSFTQRTTSHSHTKQPTTTHEVATHIRQSRKVHKNVISTAEFVKRRYGITHTKHMPTLTKAKLQRMSLKSSQKAVQLLAKV